MEAYFTLSVSDVGVAQHRFSPARRRLSDVQVTSRTGLSHVLFHLSSRYVSCSQQLCLAGNPGNHPRPLSSFRFYECSLGGCIAVSEDGMWMLSRPVYVFLPFSSLRRVIHPPSDIVNCGSRLVASREPNKQRDFCCGVFCCGGSSAAGTSAVFRPRLRARDAVCRSVMAVDSSVTACVRSVMSPSVTSAITLSQTLVLVSELATEHV